MLKTMTSRLLFQVSTKSNDFMDESTDRLIIIGFLGPDVKLPRLE